MHFGSNFGQISYLSDGKDSNLHSENINKQKSFRWWFKKYKGRIINILPGGKKKKQIIHMLDNLRKETMLYISRDDDYKKKPPKEMYEYYNDYQIIINF